jgi:hypothetical protein
MLQILGTSGANSAARRAAREVVSGYLNTSFGMNYPYSPQQIAGMWTNAVNSGDFKTPYNLLSAANSRQCPIH